MQKITPFLWFDSQAEEAANLYVSVFRNSKVAGIARYGKAGAQAAGRPEGSAMTVDFEIEGQEFVAINGGPIFKFTPAISFLVACESPAEVERLWGRLSKGGAALMDIGEYPFSPRYGWTQDRYGVSWQVMATGSEITQKITPTLMFVGDVCGKAEEAVRFYASVFHDAGVGDILRYGKDQAPDKEGTIAHVSFTLEGQEFAAMDSAHPHQFGFSEANSFVVNCKTQKEVDYYWNSLSADPTGGQCGWLKDRYGVSWQIVPSVLSELMQDNDPAKAERVMKAMLQMKKITISGLKRAYAHE